MSQSKDQYYSDEKKIYREGFGKVLKSIREEVGFSIRKLAEESGLSASYLSYIERGIHGPPSAEVIFKLSAALRASSDILLAEAGLLDPEVRDAIKRYPEKIANSIRIADEKNAWAEMGFVGLILIASFFLNADFKKEDKKNTRQTYKELKMILKQEGITPEEEKNAFEKASGVIKLWEQDMKGR